MTELDIPKMAHDEMIDTLKGLVFGTFDRTTAKEREALDMAISALKGGWIPVEERKPEEEKTYVVTVNHGNGAYITTAIFNRLYRTGFSDSKVIAWREDIEPYKKGE